LKDTVTSLDEIIPGHKITKPTKTKIEDLLTKPVKQLDNGQVLNGVWAKRVENPIEFDAKLAYFINLGLFDGKMDVLKKAAKTSATSELEKHLKNSGNHFGSGKLPKTGSKPNKETNDMLSSMRGAF
jgi:hypothetical protein